MTFTVLAPGVDDLLRVVAALATFQVDDGGPAQLHPGDIGWNHTDGAVAVAQALRVWERDGEPIAVGMLDDYSVIRLALSPAVADDTRVAAYIADTLAGSDVLSEGSASAEVRYGVALQRTLRERGWTDGEAWACFTLDLSLPVPDHGLRVQAIDGSAAGVPDEAIVSDIVSTHLAAWERSTFSTQKFHAMAAGPAFRQARFLILYAGDAPVATAAVWSAGPGRPGLIEPLGVDRNQRGHGYGRAIVGACATALREMGAGAMRVSTPVTNWPAVPLYAATTHRLPDVCDLVRPA